MQQETIRPEQTHETAGAQAGTLRRRPKRQSRLWRRTSMRRAIVEGLAIYAVARLLGTFEPGALPDVLYPLITLPLLRLVLTFLPPIWAAMRVVSTRREKMSARFWRLGPLLAAGCTLLDAAVALAFGDTTLLGGPVPGGSDLARFGAQGPFALSPGAFVSGELKTFFLLLVYYTLAVVCTRLANGGFLRFTMPAGDGRVTL